MEISMIINDFEEKLRTLQTDRVYDDKKFHNLESLIHLCSTQVEHLQNCNDPTFVALILPALLQTLNSLLKISREKSEILQNGTASQSREKLPLLFNTIRNLYNQVREFIKSPSTNVILSKSSEQRSFCHQLRLVSDSIGSNDVLMTITCQKLIVKLLTGASDEQSTGVKVERINDGLCLSVYKSVLQQFSERSRDSSTSKVFPMYFQFVLKLIQNCEILSQLDDYRDLIRILLQIHRTLEKTSDENFFSQTSPIQEILQELIQHNLRCQSTILIDDFSSEISSSSFHYGSLIVLFRLIEALDFTLTKRTSTEFSYLNWIDRSITFLFNLIDQCQFQLVLPARLPICFSKSQIEYGTLYDIAYRHLMKLFQHQSMQTLSCSMTHLLNCSKAQLNISTSIQLASELIIQSCYFYSENSNQFQDILSLFLAELLRTDSHRSLVQHLLTLPKMKTIKTRVYQKSLSSDRFQDVYQLFSSSSTNSNKFDVNLIFPNRIDQLYTLVRLFSTEFTSQQIQHAFDTCLYSIQQCFSLAILTESICQQLIISLRVLTYLIFPSNFEPLRSLLSQLTAIFVELDNQNAFDIRIDFLRLFSSQQNHLDDSELGRILDYLLTCPLESNSLSIGFHLMSLEFLDVLRQRSSRTAQINDLIIQLIVRYGYDDSSYHIFKAHLMRIFRNYINNGNDNTTLVMRVKSQCALLRSNIDKFEKNIQTSTSSISWEKIPWRHNALENHEQQDKFQFYRTLFTECQSSSCSTSQPMQQD